MYKLSKFNPIFWYSKKWDSRSCPGTMPVKNKAVLSRHSQIQHKARRNSFHFKLFYGSFALVCLYFMQAHVDWVLIIFGTQVIKKKRPIRPVFPDYLSVSCDYGHSDSTKLSNLHHKFLSVVENYSNFLSRN